MSDTVPCPMCGSENPTGGDHCTVCGYSLQPESNAGGHKCARCGSNVPDGFDFCPVCGLDQRHRFARPETRIVRIDSDPAAPVAPQPPHLQQPPPYVQQQPPPPPPVQQQQPPPPPAQTGRTVFMDGPPLPRPPGFESRAPAPGVPSDDAMTIPAPGKARLDLGAPTPGGGPGVGGGLAAPAVEHDPSASGASMLPPDMDDVQTRASAVVGPRLVLVGRDGEEGQVFPFSGSSISIGRQHGEIAFADDPFMSPQHARVERSGEMFTLVDLGSTNGVYLRTRGNASVYPGDLFMVGHQVLRLENVSDPVAEQHPSPDGTRLFGTPLKPAWGKLSLIGRGGITGDTFYLRGAKVIFGREQGDILFPRDPFVSREHAQLRLELHGAQMSVFLEDQGSANGTYIRIRGSAEVRSTDTFRVGDQILRLRLDD